ncbi:ABC transporter substrate-binding protein [Neobacillus rhizophilus]|uniref:ABC transporter substrate-binding protein n=1 Tax=Neobacillus rhizophilus TaxID=2833579 RepID=A0A942UA16_9BACI|nr:ABC transporter substrate-binding protein [Neobacillus rhizophilus]MBS4214968.1 ABC transporter substrate-binding protein [Neobacillus rhizophilus]
MKKFGMKSLILFFMLALVLSGCASKETATSKNGSSSSKDNPAKSKESTNGDTIKIGFIGALSGSVGAVGQDMKKGGELAVEMINEKGGINGKKVELVSKDTKGNPKDGIQAVRDLTQQGVKLFTGVVSSGVALAIPPVLEQENAIVMTTAAGADEITGKNFNRHVFRVSDNAYMRNTSAANLFYKKYPNLNNWANFSPDYAYGHASWDAFNNQMKKINPKYKVVKDSWPKFGATDYKNEIASILAAKPDAVFSSLYSADAITMSKQAKPYDFFKQIGLFVLNSNEGDISSALGKDMHPEWSGVHYYAEAYDNALNKEFVERFKQKFGAEPNGYNSETYVSIFAYKQAMEKSNSMDTDTLIKTLEGMKFDSVTGQREFRKEDHQAIKDIVWVKVEPDNSDKGWKVTEIEIVPGAEVMPPLN